MGLDCILRKQLQMGADCSSIAPLTAMHAVAMSQPVSPQAASNSKRVAERC